MWTPFDNARAVRLDVTLVVKFSKYPIWQITSGGREKTYTRPNYKDLGIISYRMSPAAYTDLISVNRVS